MVEKLPIGGVVRLVPIGKADSVDMGDEISAGGRWNLDAH
jgi:hypothetical protein